MDKTTWKKFSAAREHFRRITDELSASLPLLKETQQKFINSRTSAVQSSPGKNLTYTVETPIVYNTALDKITVDDEIKLILVADNPGRREQESENRRYLTGPSGKIANNFFRANPVLGIDFLKNVIILNKTPIHSPRTNELKELCRFAEEAGWHLTTALEESQKKMAALLLEFHNALKTDVWITGYSEMKKTGIFASYTEELKMLYAIKPKLYENIYIFRHFSMNQFTIDLKQQSLPGESVKESLDRIGSCYRECIL